MGDMLSQAEIDALLGGGGSSTSDLEDTAESADFLSSEQKDVLGEIGNISMGTAATTLFALLNQKVWITTPQVKNITWRNLSQSYDRPCVGTKIDYTMGLKGSNVLVLRQHDVKIIVNLMMGGDGNVPENDTEIGELDLSAIGEAMNQMIGSSSTSLSSMVNMKIDINTPQPFVLDFSDDSFFSQMGFSPDEEVVCISFKMVIGNLIDSEIVQILDKDFAVEMVDILKREMTSSVSTPATEPAPQPQSQPQPQPQQQPQPQPQFQQPEPQAQMPDQMYQSQQYQQPPPQYQQQQYQMPPPQYQQQYQMPPPQYQQQYQAPPQHTYQQQNINVQQAQFQNFDINEVVQQQKENIDIIMDVTLEVTVELGRTRKKIKEILEFSPGSIIELDKLAGEPIDILVNGKFVAKGEVVVIDENFGIRITDIINAENRI